MDLLYASYAKERSIDFILDDEFHSLWLAILMKNSRHAGDYFLTNKRGEVIYVISHCSLKKKSEDPKGLVYF